MKSSTLVYNGLDWDEGNRGKIEARVPLEVIEAFFKQELLIKEEDAYEREIEKIKAAK